MTYLKDFVEVVGAGPSMPTRKGGKSELVLANCSTGNCANLVWAVAADTVVVADGSLTKCAKNGKCYICDPNGVRNYGSSVAAAIAMGGSRGGGARARPIRGLANEPIL